MSKPREIKKEILELRSEGFSYRQICEKLNCSKGTVAYHCGKGQKEKYRKNSNETKKRNPLRRKMWAFQGEKYKSVKINPISGGRAKVLKSKRDNFSEIKKSRKESAGYNYMFTLEQLENKIGDNPICYLSGESIDLNNSREYSLDHIVPKSKGGTNDLDNCGLASSKANQAKSDLSVEEYITLCKNVLENNGHKVEKI